MKKREPLHKFKSKLKVKYQCQVNHWKKLALKYKDRLEEIAEKEEVKQKEKDTAEKKIIQEAENGKLTKSKSKCNVKSNPAT